LRRIKGCFGKGTPVLTLTGLRAIESLGIADLALSQGPASVDDDSIEAVLNIDSARNCT
jgi:hypothetical protein